MTDRWHRIADQEYPYPFTTVEFLDSGGVTWVGKFIDIPPFTNVFGYSWRAVPTQWPFVPIPA